MWKNKINTQSQPKTQESSNHVVGRASRIADNTQTPPTLKDDLEKLKIFYSNSLEAEKRDVVEFIERKISLKISRLRDVLVKENLDCCIGENSNHTILFYINKIMGDFG